jgi:hypothetical protein
VNDVGSRRGISSIVAVAVLAALAACGKDGDAPGGDEPDASADTRPDATPDTGPDAMPPDAAPPAVDCGGVGPLGRCDGEVLVRCDDEPTTTDCAANGQVCAYGDDTAGYACVDPSTVGALRVEGTMRWEDRPLSPGELGAPVALPARGAMVAVVDDATDELIATVSAADDGTYVARYDATGDVRVVVYSRSRAEARPARVRNASGYLHAVGGEPFAAGSVTQQDLTIPSTNASVGAWNALDTAVTAMDWLRAEGVATISPLIMYWEQGSNTGSYYIGDGNELHLDGDDGYDDVVALHELGHYIQDEYSASDNPGGAHDGSPADPRLAWGEGGATWFAIALRGVPYYIDYSAGGGWSVELEERAHLASPTGAMSQDVSEWMVAELIWDVSDATLDGDADPMSAGSRTHVMSVMRGYLLDPQHPDRGRAGMDLVEWLDGWFMHHGLGDCTAMEALVARFQFPYDFAGPAGACP